MPSADFFTQFGILTVRNFITPALRSRILAISKSLVEAGQVYSDVPALKVAADDYTGPRTILGFSDEITAELSRELAAFLPTVAQHYGVDLIDMEPPNILVYKAGCEFKPHVDAGEGLDADGNIRKRNISLIIYLNEESEAGGEGTYAGGNLSFFGLVKEGEFQRIGLPLTGEPGMLVAFPANFLHSVTPVTRGERYVVTSWYF
jgi:predicted 2-oxoglutarate/Fe(II)-dependent dioxygenase YbiX